MHVVSPSGAYVTLQQKLAAEQDTVERLLETSPEQALNPERQAGTATAHEESPAGFGASPSLSQTAWMGDNNA